MAYKKSGYIQCFYVEHERELLLYKAAREAFENLSERKVRKIKELNDEYRKVLDRKKELCSEYRLSKKEMQDFVNAKHNVDSFLQTLDTEQSSEKAKPQERKNNKNTER